MTPERKETTDPAMTAVRNLRHLSRDRGYRWRDQDPIVVEITELITDSGLSTREIEERVNTTSKGSATVRRQTMDRWLNGTTRRPQNYTITWVAFALGYERKWVKLGGNQR